MTRCQRAFEGTQQSAARGCYQVIESGSVGLLLLGRNAIVLSYLTVDTEGNRLALGGNIGPPNLTLGWLQLHVRDVSYISHSLCSFLLFARKVGEDRISAFLYSRYAGRRYHKELKTKGEKLTPQESLYLSKLSETLAGLKETLTDPEHEKKLRKASASYAEVSRLRERLSRETVTSGAYEGLRAVNVRDLI